MRLFFYFDKTRSYYISIIHPYCKIMVLINTGDTVSCYILETDSIRVIYTDYYRESKKFTFSFLF